MKAFIVALSFFIVITAFVIFTSIYMTSESNDLIVLAEKLPLTFSKTDDITPIYTDFAREWNKFRAPVRYFIGHTDADTIDDAIDEIKLRYDSGDISGYLAARAKLISTLDRIRSSESFTADSLF